MTKQMNTIALISNGFRIVAQYQATYLYDDRSFMGYKKLTCLQNDIQELYVIKVEFLGKSFIHLMTTKESANNRFKQSIKDAERVKRI